MKRVFGVVNEPPLDNHVFESNDEFATTNKKQELSADCLWLRALDTAMAASFTAALDRL